MGVALAERYSVVSEWYQRAEEAAGLPLSRLLREGPAEQLRRTEILQPAMLTVEVGVWYALRERLAPTVVAAAGHSLGEYAALIAAGALAAEDAVALVGKRGRYMQQAVPEGEGGMAAVIGLAPEQIAEICRQSGDDRHRVWLSNDNCPGQAVVSGHAQAIERAAVMLKEAGARRVVPLQVSAPFHCPLMQPAADRLAADLADVDFTVPAFPVIANCSARPYADADGIRAGLAKQVVQPVRFRESMAVLAACQPAVWVEAGPGTVLTGLAKRTISDISIYQVSTPEQLTELEERVV